MKKAIMFIVTYVLACTAVVAIINVSGCKQNFSPTEEPRDEYIKTGNKEYILSNMSKPFQVINIDGCEYIYQDGGYQEGAVLVHKGNCKNHQHEN